MARDGTLVALQQLDVQVMIIIIMMTIAGNNANRLDIDDC